MKTKQSKDKPAKVDAVVCNSAKELARFFVALNRKDQMSWLQAMNPLQNMTIRQAQQYYDMSRWGDTARLHWLWQEIEAVDPILGLCLERRASAVVEMNYAIRPLAMGKVRGYDEVLAAEQVAMLSWQFGAAERNNLSEAIEALTLAAFRGFSVVSPQMHDGDLHGFDILDSWNILRKPGVGTYYWNPEAKSVGADLDQLERIPEHEIVAVAKKRAIDYPMMSIYMRSALAEKKWGMFIDRYGIPPIYLTMPENTDPARKEEFKVAAEQMRDGNGGALPPGTGVNIPNEVRGVNPFMDFANHQREITVLMATGGTLGSLTGATGMGSGVSDAQSDTFRAICRRDGAAISGAINRGVTNPLMARYFPGRPILASFDITGESEPTADEVFTLAGKARVAGYRIAKEDLEESTGYTLEVDSTGQTLLAQPTPAMNKPAPVESDDFMAVYKALQAQYKDVYEALQAGEELTPEQIETLLKAKEEASPELKEAFEKIVATQFAEGVAE